MDASLRAAAPLQPLTLRIDALFWWGLRRHSPAYRYTAIASQ
jgi:hypothetical protein